MTKCDDTNELVTKFWDVLAVRTNRKDKKNLISKWIVLTGDGNVIFGKV